MVGASFFNNYCFLLETFLLFSVLSVRRYRIPVIQTCNFFSSGSVQSFFDPSKLYYVPGLSQYV